MTRRPPEDDFHKPPADLPLFAPGAPRLAGSGDHPTSLEAADRIAPKLTDVQHRVLLAFVDLGPMTDYELEILHRFRELSPSTVRKRRGELVRAGLIEPCGRKQSGAGGRSAMTVHRARQAIVDKLSRQR